MILRNIIHNYVLLLWKVLQYNIVYCNRTVQYSTVHRGGECLILGSSSSENVCFRECVWLLEEVLCLRNAWMATASTSNDPVLTKDLCRSAHGHSSTDVVFVSACKQAGLSR